MSKTPTIHSFRFIDLFAGLGGFHVALERMGGQCVFAAEIDEGLQVLYETNFGLEPQGDLTKISPDAIPSHDVLCAGFPCQPFSKAGEQLGFECTKQGRLFFDVAAILDAKRPRHFILENVPNLLKHDAGRTFDHIIEVLTGLGYFVSSHRLSPHQFGIPQIRERLYIVGSLDGLDEFTWPDASNKETSIRRVLEHQPPDARKLSKQVETCLTVWDDFLSRSGKLSELPSFPIWSMEFGATYPFETTTPFAVVARQGITGLRKYAGSHGVDLAEVAAAERWLQLPSHARTEQMEFPKWKKDFIRQNRAFYAENRRWIDPWLPKILPFPSSLQKFEWNAKGGERSIWKYVLQFRASGVRVKRPTTAPSLIAMTDTQVPIIGWERRYMTPRECARLQSIEHLQLPATNSRAFAALGNAVNAEVVGAIAQRLVKPSQTSSYCQGDASRRIAAHWCPAVADRQIALEIR